MNLSDQYSGQVRDTVLAQIADDTRGFNAQIAVTMPAAGLQPFTIDWNPDKSLNFFEANMNPEDIEATTPFRYPVATLYTPDEEDTLDQAFITYSGSVRMALSIYLSFLPSGIPRTIERSQNAVAAAIIRTFCDPSAAAQANFTGTVNYNRRIRISRIKPFMGSGQNWLSGVTATFAFGLDTF